MSELKACPFCGGVAITVYPDEYGSGGQHVPPYHAACDMNEGGCGISVVGETEEEAAATWNTRAEVKGSSAPSAEVVAWYDPTNNDPGQSVTFDKAKRDRWPHKYPVALVATATQGAPTPAQPLNGIAATMFHDEGAYAQCDYCLRYTRDPRALSDRGTFCECGETHGWSGSFKKPGPDAKWSGIHPTPPQAQGSEENSAGAVRAARSAKDYAIEHADYLAQMADQAIASVNNLHKLYQQLADGEPVMPDAINDAEEYCGESMSSLKEHVYEFRKRRDRALATSAPPPEPVDASEECQSCEGTGSGGMGVGCTDCLGTGVAPASDTAHGVGGNDAAR